MNLTRIRRLVQLIGLLQAGKGQNADQLSARCHVSRRTLFRDLDLLRQAGVPVLFDDDDGCYRIEQNYFLPPTTFTAEETLAMLLVCYEMGSGRVPFYDAARQAAIKVEACLPARLREQVRDVTAAVQIRLTPSNPLTGIEPVYRQLLHCAAQREAVRIRYTSFGDEGEIVTKLSPYRLLFSRRSWYAIGRSSLHREVRTFNVGRISELRLLSENFEVPRGFSVERYLGNAWHLIAEPGPDAHVLVRFEKLVARNVAEVQWHKTQRVRIPARRPARFSRHGLGIERNRLVDSGLCRPGRGARAAAATATRGRARRPPGQSLCTERFKRLSKRRLGEGDSPILLRGLRKIRTVPVGFRIDSKCRARALLTAGGRDETLDRGPDSARRDPRDRQSLAQSRQFTPQTRTAVPCSSRSMDSTASAKQPSSNCFASGWLPRGTTSSAASIRAARRWAKRFAACFLAPGGSRIDARSEMLLFMAARAQMVSELIAPALDAGRIVVSDRYLLANVVYQGYARGLDIEEIWQIGRVATAGISPDLTLVLDLPAAAAGERLARPLDRMESGGGSGFRDRVRSGFLAEAARRPDEIAVIDAARPIEVVQAEIRRRVEPILAARGKQRGGAEHLPIDRG